MTATRALDPPGTPTPARPATARPGRAAQAAALGWLVVLCAIDAPAPVLAPLLVAGMALAVGLVLRRQRAAWAWRYVLGRPVAWPLGVFGGVMLVNVALQDELVDAPSRPYFVNLMVLHALLLCWAWVATPRSVQAWQAVHLWTWRLLLLLTGLVVAQALVRELTGTYLDVRLWLTGVPARSGVEEGTEGLRPTGIFAEPSNHAIVVFLLALVHRVSGPAPQRVAAVAAASCLVSGSGIGLLLAAALVLDVAAGLFMRALRHGLGALVVAGAVAVGSVLLAWAPTALTPAALQRILEPSTGYDPMAVRTFVPLSILQFEVSEHLLGTGIANYASLDEGLTQYDSSFALGAYYQAGTAALAMLVWLLAAAWRRHSWAAAAFVVVLLATKMSLIAPMFWGLCVLLDRHSRCGAGPLTGNGR